jgi:hypothetical protein
MPDLHLDLLPPRPPDLDTSEVTRVEVWNGKSRVFAAYHCTKTDVTLYDDGRTLKIQISQKR